MNTWGRWVWGVLCVWVCISASHAQDADHFDVMEYRIEGTTLLPVATIEQAVTPHLGEKKTLADVENAREALESAYHRAGYLTVLVSIPQQRIVAGVVALAVTEAPVDRLRVVESRYFSLGAIKAGVPELAEGRVPQFDQMQDELAALNRSNDRRVSPILRPGKTPGTVEAELKVQDTLPVHGSVEVNDHHSQDTTPTHMSANLRFDNLWQRQHSLGINMQTVPENPDESRVLSLNYSVALESGNFLSLYGVKTDSDVAAVGTLSVIGRGRIYGARYIVALPGDSSFVHTANLGVDLKDFVQTVRLQGSDGFNTPISYMPLTLGWDGTWLTQNTNTRFGSSFNFHLPGFAGKDQEFADKRFKARAGYAYVRGNASHTSTSASGWGWGVRASWQLTTQPLISNEQFGVGGDDTVRGYLESAAMGDTGVVANLEVSTPNFGKHLAESVDEARVLVFADAGSAQVLDAISATNLYNLSSLGLGLRVRGWHGLVAALNWAVAQEDLGTVKRGDSRVNFKLSYQW
jgi:hemolysin activation/secretion protein